MRAPGRPYTEDRTQVRSVRVEILISPQELRVLETMIAEDGCENRSEWIREQIGFPGRPAKVEDEP